MNVLKFECRKDGEMRRYF